MMPLHTVCNLFLNSCQMIQLWRLLPESWGGQVVIPLASSHELVSCIVYSLQPLLRMIQKRREKVLTLPPTFSFNSFGAQGRSSPDSFRIFKNSWHHCLILRRRMVLTMRSLSYPIALSKLAWCLQFVSEIDYPNLITRFLNSITRMCNCTIHLIVLYMKSEFDLLVPKNTQHVEVVHVEFC